MWCFQIQNFEKVEDWAIAYHGTRSAHALSILVNGLRTPDEVCEEANVKKLGQFGAEKSAIYVSPSVEYAASPYYARPFKCVLV